MCHLFFCCCFFKPSFIDSLHMMWKCSANYHGARKRLNTCYWWGNGVGEAGKKEVMTVFGMSKGKTGPTGNLSWQPPLHHLCGFTGRPPLIGTECQRKDWVANIHVHQMNTCIITFFSLMTWTAEGLIMMACVLLYKGKGYCFKTDRCRQTQNLHYSYWRTARLLHQKL